MHNTPQNSSNCPVFVFKLNKTCNLYNKKMLN